MKEDLKSRIEKLKQRRYPYQNSEGKWGFTDVFGKVVEPAHLDEKPEDPYEPVKGARELDNIPVMTYREWINKYTDYDLGNKNKIEDLELLEECIYDRISNKAKRVIIGQANDSLLMYRKDYGEEYISYVGVIRYGYMNEDQKEIGECKYLDILPFSEGLARVKIHIAGNSYLYKLLDFLEDTRGLDQSFYPDVETLEKELDSDMRIKYDREFEEEEENPEVYGFINTNGEEVIPTRYVQASDFHEGLAAVSNGVGWGYIDPKNKDIIPFKFDWAGDFQDGFARVLFAGLYYVIDKEGYCYESFDEIENGMGSKFYL